LDRLAQPDGFINAVTETIKRGKPVAIWMTVMPKGGNTVVDRMEERRIPVYPSAERAVKALAALHRYYKLREALEGEG